MQELLRPDWMFAQVVRPQVQALVTLRAFDERNRGNLHSVLPASPRWLHQVHGDRVLNADEVGECPPQADASYTTRPGVVCVVKTADCLPVLFADVQGRGVAAAHAGWRGLAAGILQNTVQSLRTAIGDSSASIMAFFGPAIGPECFEVGGEVLDAMQTKLPEAQAAFVATGPGKFHANLFELARQALLQVDVRDVRGGNLCTVCDPTRFYSYRRDRVTGRHAALIWMGD